VHDAESSIQQGRILLRVIRLSLIAYLVVLVVGLATLEPTMYVPSAVGIVLLVLPAWLTQRDHFNTAAVSAELILLATLTTLATFGNGIHDTALLAFPSLFLFSGLMMRRSNFLFTIAAALLAVAWLVFGERAGLYVPQPVAPPTPATFIILIMIFLASAYAVFLLSGSIRDSLALARSEISRREKLEEQLRQYSLFDVMTGVHNRNLFEQELARLEKGRAYPISVVVVDLDGLKSLNDTAGHVVGDGMLKQAAALLKSALRSEDILARVGGDEFAALLPSTDEETALRVVARIREKVGTEGNAANAAPVRLSIGTATAESSDLLGAFALADRRMYEDKAAKRAKG